MKILSSTLLILYFFTIPVKSEEKNCTGMKKLSKEFIKCSTINIKEKTIEKASDLKKNTSNKTQKIKIKLSETKNKITNKFKKKD